MKQYIIGMLTGASFNVMLNYVKELKSGIQVRSEQVKEHPLLT